MAAILNRRIVCFSSANFSKLFRNGSENTLKCFKLQRLLLSDTTSKPGQKPVLKAKFMNDEPRIEPRQRLKNLFTIYGPTAVVLHIGLSLTFLGITYLVVRYGFDVPAFLARHSYFGESYMRIIAAGGTFGLAYALYKSMMPIRVLVTLFLTPRVARKLKTLGLIKREF